MSEAADHAAALAVLNDIADQLTGCADHAWEQVGRCVYCTDCKRRLYQGTIPSSHTNVTRRAARSWDAARDPAATQAMRDRWGMR